MALTTQWLSEHNRYLHHRANWLGMSLEDIAKELNVTDDFDAQRLSRKKWSDETLKTTATEIIRQYGCIPPYRFLQANTYGGWLSAAVCRYGDIDKIRNLYQ